VTDAIEEHVWGERHGLTVCSRCGRVRNLDKATACTGSLPPIRVRAEVAPTIGEAEEPDRFRVAIGGTHSIARGR
jgi:hypothetical protein